MLKIFNNLELFFQDNYRRINVREYARITKVSPPSASKILNTYFKEGLLKKEEDRKYIFYFANRENNVFMHLMRLYWIIKLKRLIKIIEEAYINPTVILFGSASKAELKQDSDIDIAIFSISNENKLKTELIEKELNREIQIHHFKNKESITNKELLANIINGVIIKGKI
jgi:predicted nucleotidyltransferase